MKCLLSLGLTIVLATLVVAEPQCHTSELMQCLDIVINYVHTLPKRSLPVSEQQVGEVCDTLNKGMNCALKFRDNCVTPLQKEILGLVVEGASEFVNDFCTSGSNTRKKYLANAECLNTVSISDETKTQIEYALSLVEYLNKTKHNEIITYVCCGYRKVYNTFLKMATDTCGKEAVDPVLDMIGLVAAQLPDVVCSGVEGNEANCVALLPPAGTKVSAEAKKTAIFKFLHHILKNWLD
ncbi:uncharacterized protein CEXT_361781 [Caerostris extrusa]|uniref:Uncharacterized protein n=1 Tax=Caerostris extrusa TaxID=172846 RepID=A0AAV4TZ78_CAEEX|nr:uncharacterized protein CEXT_361781 [Caerostris extrusa]